MNKDEILLMVFLYALVVLISFSRPFLNQMGSLAWAKNLMIRLQQPLSVTARVETNPLTYGVHRPIDSKQIQKVRRTPAMPETRTAVIKKPLAKTEALKG